MGNLKIRHLVRKPQKSHALYYWQPSRTLRRAGFMTRRLSNSLPEAVAQAEALNAEADAWRAGADGPTIQPGTLPWLVREYRRNPRYIGLAPKTQRSYEQALARIEAWSERARHPPLASLRPKIVEDFYTTMYAATPAMANAVLRVLRILSKFAVFLEAVERDFTAEVKLKGRPPRQVVWLDEQVEAFRSTARAQGRDSLALAVLLGANLGQREGDLLTLPWSAYDGQSIELRQGKTGALVSVPAVEELRQALDRAPRKSPQIIVSETTGRPYREDNFRHVFADIRAAAGLDGLQFMDLRRTAVVWLAEAGCEIYEISAITGHSLKHTVAILEVYLPRNAAMARNAIAKLSEYRNRRIVGREGR